MEPTAAKILIDTIRSTTHEYETQKLLLADAKDRRDAAILAAIDAGLPERVVARAAGVARGLIYSLRRHEQHAA